MSKNHFALFLAFVAGFSLTGYAEPNKGQYELQERYGRAAKEYFAGEFGTKYTKNDQTTIIYNFRNHYNAKMNKCLVLIMTRYLIKKSPRSEPSLIWLSILDINEAREFGALLNFVWVYGSGGVRVNAGEVELAGNEEQHGAHGGKAGVAAGFAFGRLEEAI